MKVTTNITARIGLAWSALTGKRNSYVGVYGNGGKIGGFAGGAVGRLTASMATWSGSINSDLDGPLPIMRARGRHLAANNEHGRRFLSMVAANIVGRNNPQLQVRAFFQSAKNQTATLDKAANDAIEIHWVRWGKTADITGKHRNLSAFWRMVAKAAARDGEALVRIVRDRNLPYGIGLQALEADRLDENINTRLSNGNAIRQGVEIDGAGRAVAYHIRTNHPGENYVTNTPGVERVPVADMMHLFIPERAEQVRGVTWFHAVIIRGSTIHRFEDAAVVAAEVGASKIAALERSDDSSDGGALGMADGTSNGMGSGIPQMSVQAGEMFELPPGYKLNSWNPEYPHANFDSFLKACLRGLAAGLDVAAHNLTGDMTDVNYSSARIAELAEREMWMCLQDWFIASIVEPVYQEWLSIALLRGDIRFETSGKALPAERWDKFANASRFLGRRWAWVDPAKEMEANQAGVQLGVTSRTRIAAEQGIDIEDVIDELEQERTLMTAAGLPLDVKPAAAVPPAPPAAAKPAPTDANLAKAMALLLARAAEPAAAPSVTVHQGDTIVHTPAVQVDNHVAPAEVKNEITLPESSIVVEAHIETPHPTRKVTEIEHDAAHEIVRTVETYETRE